MQQSLCRWSKRLLGAAIFLIASIAGAFPVAAAPDAASRAAISKLYGGLPLSFEANRGQADKKVRFLCRGQRYTLFLTDTEAVLRLAGGRHEEAAVVRMQLIGSHRRARPAGESPLPGTSNYFLGDRPREWRTGIPSYDRVRYENVYPGVDLVYRGNQRQLEYDFLIAPHADPKRIRLAFHGADTITINPQGELILHTKHGDVVQHAPEIYQEVEGTRQRVDGRYVLLDRPNHVGFALGRYDRSLPLVIDPVLVYSKFLSGSDADFGFGIASDSAGNAYVTGFTSSTNFTGVSGGSIQPTNGGGYDVFVTKINGAGATVYSTYLGGSEQDEGFAIAVDSAGNAYVSGITESSTFPGVNSGSIQPAKGGGVDAFVTKINAAGTAIVYSTFLGSDGYDQSTGIAVDSGGNAYVTGGTTSITFPGINASSPQPVNAGGLDAFVTKINAAGTAIVYSTLLGGPNEDRSYGIAVSGTGDAYVTGEAISILFPGVNSGSIQPTHGGGLSDAFVTRINPAGTAIVYSTFLGGGGDDRGTGIAVDGAGNAYVTGAASSTMFPGVGSGSLQPTNAGGQSDAFVTKINPAGTAIVYSTFLGGIAQDYPSGIAVAGGGNAYVVGITSSAVFPGVNSGSIQPNFGGSSDAFVTKINATGTAIVYSTFWGSSGSDFGTAIAVDGSGNAYFAGYYQPFDAYVTKIGEPPPLDLYALTPCRMIDTRNADGPLGGPALPPGALRTFGVTGVCGVPVSAKALSINVTIVQPAAAGFLTLVPGDASLPAVSTINFAAGQLRSNNAIVPLALDGSGGLKVKNGSTGSVHFILDVNGYFQ